MLNQKNKIWIKFFIIGILSNVIDNIILLSFFNIQITKQVLIGSAVFGLTLFLLNKLVEKKIQ